jgi:hypothetical protein
VADEWPCGRAEAPPEPEPIAADDEAAIVAGALDVNAKPAVRKESWRVTTCVAGGRLALSARAEVRNGAHAQTKAEADERRDIRGRYSFSRA